MNTPIITPEKARADYIRFLRGLQIDPTDPKTGGLIITQKSLRVEQVLSANANTYRFDIYENKGADRPAEVKLNRNDLFLATHMGLFVTKHDETTSPKKYANFDLYGFSDANFFVGNNGEAEALRTIWNGLITINTKPVDRLQDFHTSMLRHVPSRTTTKVASPQLGDQPPMWGYDDPWYSRGFFPLVPGLIFDGKADNTVQLNLGPGSYSGIEGTVDSAGSAVNTRNVLVLMFHGYIVANGAEAANRWGLGTGL